MNTLFLIFLGIILWNVFMGGKKTSKQKPTPKTREYIPQSTIDKLNAKRPTARGRERLNQKQSKGSWGGEVENLQTRLKAAARTAEMLREQTELQQGSKTKDPNDKNKLRRADWGAKAGPDIISGRNIIIFFLLLFALSRLPL